MIEQAFLRTSSFVFSAAILLAAGCKDTQSAGSGAPVTQEPGGGGGVAGPGEVKVDEPVDPRQAGAGVTATAGEGVPPDDSTTKFVECTERPTMCTREYRPVCGKLADGSRKTFGNKCVACSDPNCLGYTAGPCEGPEPANPPM